MRRIPGYIERLLVMAVEVRAQLHPLLSRYEYETLLARYRATLETLHRVLPRPVQKRLRRLLEEARGLEGLDAYLEEARRLIERYYSTRVPVSIGKA